MGDPCLEFDCTANLTTFHCCTRLNKEKNLEPYCCDVDEFLDHHFNAHIGEHGFLLHPDFEHEIEKGEEKTTTINEDTSTTTRAPSLINHSNQPTAHKNMEPHSLGWTFIGIASGVIVLLVFVLVLASIVFIFYRWRKKHGRDRRARYQSPCSQEVVVYRSAPPQCIGTEMTTIVNEMQPACSAMTSSGEQNEASPPPYEEKEIQACSRQNSNSEQNQTTEKMSLQIPKP